MTGPDRRHAASSVPGLGPLLSPSGWPHASGGSGRFHALFGRDAAIASLAVLPARPDVARATLRQLAALQGSRNDDATDEEPGKIVHEWWPRAPARLVDSGWPVRDGEVRYYGSADSTLWFLVLLASLGEDSLESELEEAWRQAGDWLERALERGHGFVRYGPRRAPGGLSQQGWRDAIDPANPAYHGAGIVRPDGEAPRPPLADADTQAVAVVALRALARLSGESRWQEAAKALGTRVEKAFGTETIALEADGGEVPGAGSHLGWLLWADALSPPAREAAADRLSRPDILTPWGLRTLSAEHPLFAADAYHRGAIWPFDSWLGWSGLRKLRPETARSLRRGLLAAIESIGYAPELFAAGPRGPEPIPMANRVQAWTVAARWALSHGWDGRAKALFGRAAR
jgi:glycogen debranching enzyme